MVGKFLEAYKRLKIPKDLKLKEFLASWGAYGIDIYLEMGA